MYQLDFQIPENQGITLLTPHADPYNRKKTLFFTVQIHPFASGSSIIKKWGFGQLLSQPPKKQDPIGVKTQRLQCVRTCTCVRTDPEKCIECIECIATSIRKKKKNMTPPQVGNKQPKLLGYPKTHPERVRPVMRRPFTKAPFMSWYKVTLKRLILPLWRASQNSPSCQINMQKNWLC